ncbi:MAG: hypothetical protein ABIA93_00775 [Candidatus Woesearchaeota archaeon]
MRIVAFDSKKVKIKLPTQKDSQPLYFEALLGVGITVNNYEEFASQYEEIIERIFSSNGLKRSKVLYKSSDLFSIFYGLGIDLLPELADKLLELVSAADIFYHHVPKFYDDDTKTLNKIGVYYDEEMERVSNVEYLDLIAGPFPSICCYSYLHGLKTEIKGTTYMMDDCPGLMPSKATVGVISNPNTQFLYKGDLVNYAVNAADIICRYIEERVRKENVKVDQHLVRKLGLPETKCIYHFISPKFIHALKPSRKILLNVTHKYPHPVYYFFSEATSAFNNPKSLLENSEIFRLALKKASLLGGTVKLYTSVDQQWITKEDFLVTHNDHADKLANELKRCGCAASIVDHTHLRK